MIWALVAFDIACGVPCEHIEVAGPYYSVEQCLDAREPMKHKYLMNHNQRIWAVCIAEDSDG